jgi:hypothetical protein
VASNNSKQSIKLGVIMFPFRFFSNVIDNAISEIREASIPVFTFVLYHDHESSAVSVCVDTEDNSNQVVQRINRFNMKYFMGAIQTGDLKAASLWQANIGRSLSLGDFSLVNIARRPLGAMEVNDRFYVEMVQAMVAKQHEIAKLTLEPERLVLACSGENDEVAYVWSLLPVQQ